MTTIIICSLSVIGAIALACVLVARSLSTPACRCGGRVKAWKIGNGYLCHCAGCDKIGPLSETKQEAVDNWRQG